MANQTTDKTNLPGVPWWLVLIQGIAAIILGILLFMSPVGTLIVLIQLLGIYWLVSGILSIVLIFRDSSAWGWKLLSGILGVAAGVLIWNHPLWSTILIPTTIAFTIGIFGVGIGISQLIQAFRGAGWATGILGVVNILLGILLITRPVIAGLALPWVLGGLLIAGGILALFLAFSLRSAEKKYQKTMESEAVRPPETGATPSARPQQAVEAPPTPHVPAAAEQVETPETGPGITDAAATAAAVTAGFSAISGSKPSESEVAETPVPVEGEPETAFHPVEPVALETAEDSPADTDVPEDPAYSMGITTAGVAAAYTGDENGPSPEITGEEIAPQDVDLTGNVDLSDTEEMAKFRYPLEYVEGIGPVYAKQLKAAGLVTCLDLLKAGATRKGRDTIAEQTGISSKLILEWTNHVDLYRIKGIGSEYADLLEAAGVDTVVELAHRNPGNLLEKMTAVNDEKSLVRKIPTQSQVDDWVDQAKRLPRVIMY